MIPQQTFESYPVFGDNATKIKPDDAKYAAGFQQSDVLPAEWMNWAWGKNTKGITDLNRGMTSVETEILNVLTAGGQTPAEATGNQLLQSINYLIGQAETRAKLAAHPIGSLYWSGDSTDPGQLFGGTWAPVKDCFVWAKGDSDTANAIGQNAIAGGAKTVTLEIANLPSHNHTFSGSEVTTGASSAANTGTESSHTHDMQHYHSRGTMEITGQISNASGTFGVMGFEASASAGTDAFSFSSFSGHNRTGDSGSGGKSAKVLSFKASSGWSGLTSNSLTSGSAAKNSTGAGSSHSHTMAHTHNVTASGTIGSTGSGTAVNKMPPYIIKYCWERTA